MLLTLGTAGLVGHALLIIAQDILFPVDYVRLAPSSPHGCSVVVEMDRGMVGQHGRIFTVGPRGARLDATGSSWSADTP